MPRAVAVVVALCLVAVGQASQTPGVSPIPDALSRYSRGDWTGVERLPSADLRSVRQELTNLQPNLFLAAGPIQGRHLLAAFATEVAARSMTRAPTIDYLDMLEFSCELVRGHGGNADAFDDAWFSAYLSGLEAVVGVGLELHLKHVKVRLPRHPEIARAEALEFEIRMAAGGQRLSQLISGGQAPSTVAARSNAPRDTARMYTALLKDPEFAAEARARLAFVHIVNGKPRNALETLAAMPATEDSTVQFWSALFRGTALRELGRLPEAVAVFREAVKVAPRASSANIALAGALQLNGRLDEAHQITEDLLRSGPGADPWYSYYRGSFRKIDRLLDDVRKQLR